MIAEIVCPGKRLGRVGEFRAGPGTYVRGSYIFASVVGPKVEQAGADEDSKPFLIVSAISGLAAVSGADRPTKACAAGNFLIRTVHVAVGVILEMPDWMTASHFRVVRMCYCWYILVRNILSK